MCKIESMKDVIAIFAVSLLLTVMLEEGTALILGIRKGFDLTVILFANTLTNPAAVFAGLVMAAYTAVPRAVYVTVLELAVFVVEALVYRKLLYTRKPSPFIVSLILNSVSFFLGTTACGLILKLIP